jgi:hypothetical protein
MNPIMPIPEMRAATPPAAKPLILKSSSLNIGTFTFFSTNGKAMSRAAPITIDAITYGSDHPIVLVPYGTSP